MTGLRSVPTGPVDPAAASKARHPSGRRDPVSTEVGRLVAAGVTPAIAAVIGTQAAHRRKSQHIRHTRPGACYVSPDQPNMSAPHGRPADTHPMPPAALTTRDTEILRFLQGTRDRLIDIGRYRKAWTADDVDRVALGWLYRTQPPVAHGGTVAPVVALRVTPKVSTGQPPTMSDSRTVATTPAVAAVLTELCRFATNTEIADALGSSVSTVKTQLRRAFRDIGAKDRAHAAVLLLTGQVTIEVHDRRKTI